MATLKIHQTPAAAMAAISPFQREIDRLFGQPPGLFQFPFGRLVAPLFSFASPTKELAWLPAAEMTEASNQYVITAEVPGLKKEQLEIAYSGGVLTISGEKKEEKKKEDARYYTFERTYGYFERAFAFPAPVNPDKITATVTDGVLSVQVPKTQAQKGETKKIPVAAGE
jgi:HSP20 family protein